MAEDILAPLNLNLTPEPQHIEAGKGFLKAETGLAIELPAGADEADRFAAEYLAECLSRDLGIAARLGDATGGALPVHLGRADGLKPQGYRMTLAADGVRIQGADAAGVYYATQTLRQCFFRHGEGLWAPACAIADSPDLTYRATHYDTKHHQDTLEYVDDFIRELAAHKINMLIWEWEDKFAYTSHPMIGAPGAFTA